MPYIKKGDRVNIDWSSCHEHHPVRRFDEFLEIKNAGELNYVFTILAIKYFQDNGGRYQQINDVIGALEGAKLEFTRRIVAPYEDQKILENGDVYPAEGG